MQQNQGAAADINNESVDPLTSSQDCVAGSIANIGAVPLLPPSNLNCGEGVVPSTLQFNHKQPETLNLPAVLWDRPAGSKIRVPPPVPPRSPRRPIDPVASGAFDAAGIASNQTTSSSQRG